MHFKKLSVGGGTITNYCYNFEANYLQVFNTLLHQRVKYITSR